VADPITDAIRAINPRSPLLEDGAVTGIARAAQEYNVDWRLFLAVAQAETQMGTTGGALGLKNAWGLGPGRSYPDWATGARAFAQTIKWNRDNGRTTVAQVQTSYAPSRAANDPTGLNSNWTRNVTGTLTRIGGNPNDLRLDRPGGTVERGQSITGAARDGAETVAGAVDDAVGNPVAGLVQLLARLFDPSVWLRVLAAVGGVVAIILSLVLLMRGGLTRSIRRAVG